MFQRGRSSCQFNNIQQLKLYLKHDSSEHKTFQLIKEAFFLLLTGIGDESIQLFVHAQLYQMNVDSHERLNRVNRLNVTRCNRQSVWEFGKVYFLEMENPWSLITHASTRMVKQVSEEVMIFAERIAKSANPLALLAAAQPYSDTYYQAPKPQRSNATSSSTRQSASTRHKGKEVAKPITPQSESVSKEDSDPEQAQRDQGNQKNFGTPLQRIWATMKECRMPKRVKDYGVMHKENETDVQTKLKQRCSSAKQSKLILGGSRGPTVKRLMKQELEHITATLQRFRRPHLMNPVLLVSLGTADVAMYHMIHQRLCAIDNQVDQNSAESVDESAAAC
ncbi:hypothetical protein Tco_1524094 [Tanacetum coccineum]